ncbi:MAG: lysylphosphatidylglycerol synthase transmembrane domain-containing protein [Gammaproteobacteria bacterium]|nr:lysylphosphatidylglycerol synthase transmembrane domain-containing protein [Gammaproteobacteria bacterium]MDD9959115.1 lysylphosphatidylglycerol synthase transmembrane domain-containing protein [Gammaproteobacteria bacterium]
MNITNKLLPLFSWIVALALAIWILSFLPLDAVLQSLTAISFSDWFLWIGLNIAVILLLTSRWQILTNAMQFTVGFFQLLRVRQAGQLISFVTPGPQFGGEPLQIYWLWRKFAAPVHMAFLAVGLDRFFELWVNFTILLLAALTLLYSSSAPLFNWQYVALVLLAVISMMLIGGWFLIARPENFYQRVSRIIQPWLHHERLQQLDAHLSEFHNELKNIFSNGRQKLRAALLMSILAWAVMLAEFWVLLSIIDIPLSVTTYILLFTLMRLAFLLPLPGGIGTVEAALFSGFQILSLPLPAATSLIALIRLRDIIILLFGASLLPGLHNNKTKDISQ